MSAREWFGLVCAYAFIAGVSVLLVVLFGFLLETSPPLAWTLFGVLVLAAGAVWGLS